MSGANELKQGASYELIKNATLMTLVLQSKLKCGNAEVPGSGASALQQFNPQITAKKHLEAI